MHKEPQIVFHDLPVNREIENVIDKKISGLETYFERITSCRVVVSVPHRHKRHGNQYDFRIEIGVPGKQIIVDREPTASQQDEDWRVAVRDAFERAYRQLEEYSRQLRGNIKTHEPPSLGFIKFTVPIENYGFIATIDDRDIYFHRHAVADDQFDELEPGDEVTFNETLGEKGPQATMVSFIRHNPKAA